MSQKCKQRMILKQSDEESTRLGIATKWNGISSPPKNIFKAEKLLQLFMQNCTYLRGTHNEYLWSMRISREPVFNLPHRLQLESSFLSLIVSLSVKRKNAWVLAYFFPFQYCQYCRASCGSKGAKGSSCSTPYKNRSQKPPHPVSASANKDFSDFFLDFLKTFPICNEGDFK